MTRLHLAWHLQGRRLGHRGGAILPHRSLWRLRLTARRLAAGALMTLFFSAVLGLAQSTLAMLWSRQLVWWMQALALSGQFALPDLAGIGLTWRRWIAPQWGLVAQAEQYRNPSYTRLSLGVGAFAQW